MVWNITSIRRKSLLVYDITAPIEEVEEGFKSGKLYLNITFCIVTGEDGNVSAVNDDTSNVYQRISDMYPEVGFDTFNP